MRAGAAEEVVALVLGGSALATRFEDIGLNIHAVFNLLLRHLPEAGELQQLGKIGGWALEHQLQQVGCNGLVEIFCLEEGEQVINPVCIERDSAILAVQVFEFVTEESAEIFRAEIQFGGDFLDEREEIVREDVLEAVFRHAPGDHLCIAVRDGVGDVLAQILDVVVGQRDGGGVGVGVHAVGAGQHALEDGGAVGQGLAGLLRDTVEGHQRTLLNDFQCGLHVFLGCPEDDLCIVVAGVQRFGGLLEDAAAHHVLQILAGGHVRTFEAGYNLQSVRELAVERMAGLGEVGEQTCELRQVDGIDLRTALDSIGDGVEIEVELLGIQFRIAHFPIVFADAGFQFLADGEQRPLTEAFHVGDFRDPFGVGHTLHLDTGAAGAAHVHVLTACADARAYAAGAAVQEADVVTGLLHLVRVHHFGVGHRLDEWHTQSVSTIDTGVSDVGNLTAGIFLHTELDEAYLLVLELDFAVDTQDSGSLETGRDGTVEVLFTGDVHLAHDFELGGEGDFEGVLQCLGIDGERRGIIDFVGARRAVRDTIYNVLAGFEFHEGRTVIFAHLGKGRAHVAQQLRIVLVRLLEDAGGAAAEELLLGG